jgi:hypothetical protein
MTAARALSVALGDFADSGVHPDSNAETERESCCTADPAERWMSLLRNSG